MPADLTSTLEVRDSLLDAYADVLTPEIRAALDALAPLDDDRRALMHTRLTRRSRRSRDHEPIAFLPDDARIGRTNLSAHDARNGRFVGSEIPADLCRQWIQGTGPGAKPHTTLERSIRNAAYALLSGADGWMFDGEDALGQLSTMSLDNQRNLALAIHRDPVFLTAAESVADEMNQWAESFLGRRIIADWRTQLDFTTVIFRARGLHLDDRHIRRRDGTGFSASIVDVVTFLVRNHARLRADGRSLVLYLPKIQTADEAALWSEIIETLERHLGLPLGTVKTYVLVEQFEACFQLMEIRAALGPHFVGFNTGRWDYINSVADALAWNPTFVNPNIDAVTMTYAYMRAYEDRVRRAVNTPDQRGGCALWQGGMEPNIPVGSPAGVESSMARAIARAARRRQRQVGRSLEDGPHRPARVGASRAGQPVRAQLCTPRVHGRRRECARAARASGAHRSRRAGPDQRRHPVRQRIWSGHAGRGTQTGGFLRQ